MTAALVIAAGKTAHKNRFSPEKRIGRITAIERIVVILKMAGIRRIVVMGEEDGLSQKLVPSMNLIFLTAPAGGEMLDSVKEGLDYLKDKCTEVLVTHVGVPRFSEQTVEALLDGSGDIRIPVFRGKGGHPVLLRSSCFEKIVSYSGENGLQGAIEASGFDREMIETGDAGILAENQSRETEKNLRGDRDIRKMKVTFQVKISKEKGFYGPGVHHLLQLTEEFGSLYNACQHMGLSYTKGRRMIALMEEQLGTEVLETRQGGKSGGYSHLTKEAKKMMSSYSAFQAEADVVLQEIFQKHFSQTDV